MLVAHHPFQCPPHARKFATIVNTVSNAVSTASDVHRTQKSINGRGAAGDGGNGAGDSMCVRAREKA